MHQDRHATCDQNEGVGRMSRTAFVGRRRQGLLVICNNLVVLSQDDDESLVSHRQRPGINHE